MKYSLLTLALSFMLIACSSEESKNAKDTAKTTVEMEAPVAEEGPTDPVCDMIVDDTWTAYSVNGTDTIRFCSEGCKMAYDARPHKYNKKG